MKVNNALRQVPFCKQDYKVCLGKILSGQNLVANPGRVGIVVWGHTLKSARGVKLNHTVFESDFCAY